MRDNIIVLCLLVGPLLKRPGPIAPIDIFARVSQGNPNQPLQGS